jgi:MFS transporter, FHS family, Na+ dependent glucose transporter 1
MKFFNQTHSTEYQNHPLKTGTFVYFISFITLGLFASILGPTLPYLAKNTSTSLSEIGLLFTARSLGYIVGALQGGNAFDRFPGHKLLAAILISLGVVGTLIPFVYWIWILIALIFLLGIGEAVLDIGVNLLIVWKYRGKAAPFLNALHFCFGIGAFLSPIFVAQAILITGKINWAFWLLLFLALPIALWFLQIKSPEPTNNNDNNDPQPQNLFLVIMVATLFTLYVGAEVSYGGWIFTFTTEQGLGNSTSAAYLTSAFWGALTLGRLLGIPIANRINPKKIILFDLIGCLICLGIILFFQDNYLAIWVGTIGLGFAMASYFPTMMAFAERRIDLSGQITRWFFFAAGIGGMVLPWLFGILFESLGAIPAMWAIMIDLIIALTLFGLGNLVLDKNPTYSP